jgi:BlaI family penicillinase repressor
MARQKGTNPTDRELEILRVLWEFGPSTVRRVHEIVSEDSETGYTTSLKFMQIMLEKGLVVRDTSARTHIYRAVAEEANVQRQLAADLVNKAFGGSAQKLVMQALEEKQVPQREIIRIQRMLDELEGVAK